MIEANHIVFRQFANKVALQLCWAKKAPVSVRSPGVATGSICSMESVKEVFPNLNHKGSGRCKVETTDGGQCGAEAYYFCRKCSYFPGSKRPKLFFMCGARTKQQCGCKHLQLAASPQ